MYVSRELGPAPNPGAALPQECSWGLRPGPRYGSAPDPVGAPPQTSGRLRRKNVAGDSAPRPPLGLRPRPRSERGLGRGPNRRGPLATPLATPLRTEVCALDR